MKIKLPIVSILLLLFSANITFSQEILVSGIVLDESGPLPGVSILKKGTTEGTETNFDGEYKMKVMKGDVLVFSFVGMEEVERVVKSSRIPNVIMKASNVLEEIVIVGYGSTTKNSFTGSVKKVGSETLLKKSVSNVSQAISGESAGIQVVSYSGQPGKSATIRIRGVGSVNGSAAPLYILDGVPYAGSLSSINPSDIASTTILKDASATAVYGSRGANGVIVITTKSGKSGKPYIEIDTKTGVNMSLLPLYETLTSPDEYIELSWEGLKNKGKILGKNPIEYANKGLFDGRLGIDPKYNMWNVKDGSELIDPSTGKVRPNVTRKYTPEKWSDYAYQPSIRLETNLRMGGGNDKTKYFSSFGYLNDIGYVVKSDYKRYSTRLNLEHKVFDWIKAGMNIGYSRGEVNNASETEDSSNMFVYTNNMPIIYPLFLRDDKGNFVSDIFGGNQYDYGKGRRFFSSENAVADAHYNRNFSIIDDLNMTANFTVSLSENFDFETRYGVQIYNSVKSVLYNKFYGQAVNSGGRIVKEITKSDNSNFLKLLRYTKKINDHNISAFIAHENNEFKTNFFEMTKSKLVNPFGLELENAVVNEEAESDKYGYKIESYFGQVNYNYADTYFLSGTLRRDGSSRFKENKWGTFGSVGFAWLLNKEDFLKDNETINRLKLKFSYGVIGEQGVLDSNGYSVYYPGYDLNKIGISPSDESTLIFDTKGNKNLTWEVSNMFQAGVEFSLFNNYIEGGIDYYSKLTDDLLFDRRVGPSNGYAIFKVNDGELINKGVEVELTGHIIKKEKTFFDISVNAEFLGNEILKMPKEPSTGKQKVIDIDGVYGRAKNHSLYDFYMREYAGVDPKEGTSTWVVNYVDKNSNKAYDEGEEIKSLALFKAENPEAVISEATTKDWSKATAKYIGKSAFPVARGAFTFNLGINNFDFSAQFLYSLGGYSYDYTYQALMHNGQAGSRNWHKDIRNRWQKETDETTVPRLSASEDTNVNSRSTRFLTKSDYLNLNNIKIGYTLPKDFLANIGISNVKIWISGDNLWLLSKRKGFNPSTSITGSSSSYRYSPLSTITSGVSVKF